MCNNRTHENGAYASAADVSADVSADVLLQTQRIRILCFVVVVVIKKNKSEGQLANTFFYLPFLKKSILKKIEILLNKMYD